MHGAHVHAHVLHGRERPRAQGRDVCRHARAGREGRAAHPGAVHRFGHQREGFVLRRLDDHVVGLGVGDLELVHLDWPHVLTVRRHDGHLQSWDAHVEDHLRGGVDEAQAHPFAWREQARPVVGGAVSVDQELQDGARHVGDIGRVHTHLGPLCPLLECLVLAREEPGDGLFLRVEDTAVLLHPLEDQVRVHEAEVRKNDDMLAVIGHRVRPGRVDDDRPVVTLGLLEPGVTVVPVGAGLPDRELIDEGLAGLDAGEGHARNAIHLERHQKTVPMDGGVLVEVIGHRKPDVLAFPQPQQGSRNCAVDGDGVSRATIDREARVTDPQVYVGSHQRRQGRTSAQCGALRPAGQQGA